VPGLTITNTSAVVNCAVVVINEGVVLNSRIKLFYILDVIEMPGSRAKSNVKVLVFYRIR
jgi:hypothetical protein